jgi:hypothetical protein
MGKNAAREKRIETLKYIQTLLNELRAMAGSERQQLLAYLIEMAYLEASDGLRKMHGSKEAA